MLPPSRGKLKAGALAPAAKGINEGINEGENAAERGAGDPLAFSPAGFLTGGFPAAGLAAAIFDVAVVRAADFPGAADFNFFDGGLCDAFEAGLPVCLFFVSLLDLLAVVLRVFEIAVFADFADRARGALAAEGFGIFLRVFFDIRLPFVAFRGSIIELLRQTGIEQTIRKVSRPLTKLTRNSTHHPSAR